MQTPTTEEIHAAIQVLKKLGERINEQASHSILKMPESQLGEHYAAQIEVNSIEQITRIETVAMQLQNWRDELLQPQEQSNSNHV
ncbi:MAG: hypothetical protein ABR955_15415 [Verrucomicrobiota bacterium]|jgi:hypothetical protein